MIAANDLIVCDLLLAAATCAGCGDVLVEGELVGATGDDRKHEPWCLGCVRELLHARADERPSLSVQAAGI